MSRKHEQQSRTKILARRNDFGSVKIVFVPKGTLLRRDITGRMRVVHANPHVSGAKERERARRTYMQSTHGEWSSNLRSAPTLCQDANPALRHHFWRRA